MGPARSNGYRVEQPPAPSSSHSKPNGTVAVSSLPPKPRVTPSTQSSSSSSPHRPSGRGRPGERGNRHLHRRPKDSGCRNPQVRKGIGSCVFVLGIPCLIAGLILTIVSSTDGGEDENKYPASFPVLGPILLALSVICFASGVILYNVAILHRMRDCFGLSDKDSCCRRRFPRLCGWLRPDLSLARTQTAINNLQTVPARSALRKAPNPDLIAMESNVLNETEDFKNHHHHPIPHPRQHVPRRKRAVTFSQGDDLTEGDFLAGRTNSVSSEPDRFSVQSGSSLNGHSPSSSLLSLRNCRIHPKDDVFWAEGTAGGVDEDLKSKMQGGDGTKEGAVFGSDQKSEDGAQELGGGSSTGGGVSLPLSDITEEKV